MAQLPYITLIVAITCYVFFKLISRAFFTPLRSIPGPFHARLCNWRMKIAVLSGSRADYIHTLHQKYGPVVRVTPEEVAVSDAASFKEIHRIGGGFLKSNWYEYMSSNGSNGSPSLFNMTDPKGHAVRRKLLARGFSQIYIREQWEEVVRQKVNLAVSRIKSDATSGTADVLKWWIFLATDVSAHLIFGESFKMLESGVTVPYVDALEKAIISSTILWELPLVHRIGRALPFPSFKAFFYSNDVIFEQGALAVKNSKAQGHKTTNIFATMINEAEKGDGTLTDAEVQTEAGNLIIAGSDTTGITLTYLTWAVLKQPALQKLLEEEVGQLQEPLTDVALEKLPILDAVIHEALRLYCAAPATLPRVTPKGGATLQGHFIPQGTIIGTQSWSLHRDPALFPNPEQFDHTRWLPPNQLSPAAKQAFAPYGAGSRVCIGIHLARMELRMATAAFFRECRGAKLAPSTTDASMQPLNYFIIAPTAHKCEVTM